MRMSRSENPISTKTGPSGMTHVFLVGCQYMRECSVRGMVIFLDSPGFNSTRRKPFNSRRGREVDSLGRLM